MQRSANAGDAESAIAEVGSTCLLMRSRLIARVVTAIHDDALRPFEIGSPQFVLLVVIFQLQPATRAEIGRFHHQDRSTLTRNLKIVLAEGWVAEVAGKADGRRRPVVLTGTGTSLLLNAVPAWRDAQAKTRTILGQDGAVAVAQIADGILRAQTAP